MPNWDHTKQLRVKLGNAMGERGNWEFTTTGLSVEVPTHFDRIRCVHFDFLEEPNGFEELHSTLTITTPSVSSSKAFTVERKLIPIVLTSGSQDPTDHVASNDLVLLPVGIVPVASTLVKCSMYSKTKAGGAPIINLGSLADPNLYISDTEAIVAAGSGAIVVVSNETDFVSNAYPVIAAGTLILASTTGGTGTDPFGTIVQCELLPVPTSGLTFAYEVTH